MERSSLDDIPDSAEFAANRQGAMTQAQRVSIGVRLAVDGCLALGIGLVGLIVGRIVWLWRQATPWPISVAIVVVAALLLLAALMWCLARLFSGLLDLAAGQVEQAEGRIAWMGRGYGAQIKGRRLRLISGRNTPPPGDYRFFYLPRSGWLLAIEKLALPTGAQANSDLLYALACANRFSAESLEANRAGRLPNDQAWQLLTPMLTSFLVGLLVIGAALAIICIILIRSDLRPMGMIIPIVFAMAVLAAIYLWNDVTTILPDILTGRVAMVEGTVYKRMVSTSGHHRRRTDYFYEIHDRRFGVSRQGYDALFAGLTYRLYYAPNSRIMVSIEPLASPVGAAEQPKP